MAMTDEQELILKGFSDGLKGMKQRWDSAQYDQAYQYGDQLRMATSIIGLGGASGLQGRLSFIENKLSLMEMTQNVPNQEVAELKQQIEALRRDLGEITQIAAHESYGAYA